MTDPIVILLFISAGFFLIAANSRRLVAWSEGRRADHSAQALVLWLGIISAAVLAAWNLA
jgi:hypothetical protein